ncbi:NAD(P)H-hydrate epimerase [Trichinella nelsoni]|uniref:NAD(P)H-hydrate epimerase n=1 Tax=Trichinella nelsoni TaxID=6336 RepID=A0A0V0RNF7_9BILA|nr:NAD(P)H-hydrate epimerase [Trichinella nelsoni]
MMNSNLQQHKRKPWSSPLRQAINMVKFVSRATAHNIEAQLVNKYCFSVDQLMELRGKACANSILKFYPPVHAMSNYKRIMVICGPDNNGGNGLNYEPLIVYAAKPKSAIMKRLLSQAREFQIPIFETTDDIDWSHVDLIIDAVQGLHSNPPVKKPYKQIVASVIGFISIPIVSIDIPSGWHADEGPIGPDALRPETLISLTVPKKCAEKFTGEMHILAGRFVPKTLDKQYELHLPPYYKDHDYTQCRMYLQMKTLNWVIDPFSNTDEIEIELEEELIYLQTNKEIKPKFKNRYHSFWLQKQIFDLYPGLWRMVRRFLLAFPSSYLVERGFSVVTDFLTKKEADCKSPNVVIYDCSLPTLNPISTYKDSIQRMAREGSDVYTAECIMNERKRKGKKEYLVRWEGYSEKHDTWEPASHILGYELLQEYNEAKKNGFKNAFEYNKHKENQLGKSAAKKSKKESNAPSTKNAGEQVRRKHKSGGGKQKSELNASGDDKKEDASVENQEAEGKEESETAKKFCEWIKQLPLSMNSGPSPGLYSRSNLTIGEFEEKLERFLQLLRDRKKTSLLHKPNKN